MGTFAGNDGHRTANPAQGQPTRDEAYERVARSSSASFRSIEMKVSLPRLRGRQGSTGESLLPSDRQVD